MNSKEAFKIGFLMQCAAENLSKKETDERIKTAACMTKMAYLGKLLSALGWAARKSFWATAIVPPVAGLAGGYMLSKARSSEFNTDEAKRREVLAEYYRAIDRLKRSRQLKSSV